MERQRLKTGKFGLGTMIHSVHIPHLGDALLRLAQPLEPATPPGRHVARWGNMIYGITLVVRDLDAAQDWLGRMSVRTSRLNPELPAADPAGTFGAPHPFA